MNLKNELITMAIEVVDFDPDLIDIIGSYFAVCGKYAMIFAIFSILTGMVIKAFKGKEKFL